MRTMLISGRFTEVSTEHFCELFGERFCELLLRKKARFKNLLQIFMGLSRLQNWILIPEFRGNCHWKASSLKRLSKWMQLLRALTVFVYSFKVDNDWFYVIRRGSGYGEKAC
jgi:hypothetical protein